MKSAPHNQHTISIHKKTPEENIAKNSENITRSNIQFLTPKYSKWLSFKTITKILTNFTKLTFHLSFSPHCEHNAPSWKQFHFGNTAAFISVTSVQSSKWKRGGIYDINSGYNGKEENIQENNFCYVATIPAWEKHAEKNKPTVTHWISMSFFPKILLTWGYLNKWGLLLFVRFISLWHGEAFFAAIPPTGLVRI